METCSSGARVRNALIYFIPSTIFVFFVNFLVILRHDEQTTLIEALLSSPAVIGPSEFLFFSKLIPFRLGPLP